MSSDWDRRVVDLWDEWIAETGQGSGDPEEFVDWAMAGKRLAPRPQEIKRILRRQVTQSLRQARRRDESDGFTYRAKQCVLLLDGGSPVRHYFDTDKGGTANLRQRATKQRREAIAYSVYLAACDVERMNKVFSDEPQLSFMYDFTDDVAELRAAELLEDEDAAD